MKIVHQARKDAAALGSPPEQAKVVFQSGVYTEPEVLSDEREKLEAWIVAGEKGLGYQMNDYASYLGEQPESVAVELRELLNGGTQ